MQHEVALRWYGTGADEKVEDLPFVRGLRRCEGAHDDPNLRFLTGRSTPQGETYSKNLKIQLFVLVSLPRDVMGTGRDRDRDVMGTPAGRNGFQSGLKFF